MIGEKPIKHPNSNKLARYKIQSTIYNTAATTNAWPLNNSQARPLNRLKMHLASGKVCYQPAD
ncbi:hypothetical protein HYC85_015302 [Camellia sinensis]|uniref:Uncharacterized protein n=1 Tax=Camellia sinensis TaxID=4442 RepID=A0A7J7H007_CAMSI|nr:hypothetical protein HYC85_015302 [Camellia sinensis]